MKVDAIKPSAYKNYCVQRSAAYKSKLAGDCFIKQSQDISFSGFRKKKGGEDRVDKNIGTSVKDVSVKGMPFLLGLATSIAMVKMGDGAQDLLCDEDGYLVSDNGVKSDLINIDEKEGIIKFEGTGIEICADDYDVADWENGIFRNYDGSVDIDLANNKFIDTENGIFVDPVAKISAVLDGNNFENIAIPSFAGYQTWPNSMVYRSDHEELMKKEHERIFGTQEKKSPFEKASDFIKGLFQKDSMPQTDGVEDIFGNSIMVAKDNDGDTYLTSMPGLANSPVFAEFQNLLHTDKETAVETFNDMRLHSYLEENYPSFGTRVLAYEGGRGCTITPPQDDYDREQIQETLDKISKEGTSVLEPGSDEAVNFAKYQNTMLKIGLWKEPVVSPNSLLDIDGDDIPDIDLDGDGIPDYDMDGDGLIDLSSENGGGILGAIGRIFGKLIDPE